MKLLVILVCLLSERFLIHSFSLNRGIWLDKYIILMSNNVGRDNIFKYPWLKLLVMLGPVILIIGIIYWLSFNLLFGLLGFILSLVIFFYSLGPKNPFYPVVDKNSELNPNRVVANYLVEVNTELYAPIFWYLIGGPIAALTYRLIALSRNNPIVNQEATRVTHILEWIPARMTSLLYLLAGNFQQALLPFLRLFLAYPNSNAQLLEDSGLQALKISEQDESQQILEAEQLVEYATIILLVLIALFTLVYWL